MTAVLAQVHEVIRAADDDLDIDPALAACVKAERVIGGGAAGWELGARCGPASASCGFDRPLSEGVLLGEERATLKALLYATVARTSFGPGVPAPPFGCK